MTGPALLIVVEAGEDLIDDGALAVLLTAVQRAAPDVHVVPVRLDVHEPDLAPVLDRELRSGEPVIAVPLMLSPGARISDDLARELEEDRGRASVLAAPVGPDDAIVDLMVTRLHRGGLGAGDVVVMAAVGSSDHHAVRESVEVGRRLAHVLERFVTVGFFTAAVPRLAAAVDTMRRLHPGSRVALASYLLSAGRFAEATADAV
jgi:sirohydrochlorin ferrochelatase